jgi:N-acetylmuramoyl-L-alanine amidase
MIVALRLGTAALCLLLIAWPVDAAPAAASLYQRALEREAPVRISLGRPKPDRQVIASARAVIASYEALVRRYPRSGYCDNALWQAAELSSALWAAFGEDEDRIRARRLYRTLTREYPSSSLARQVRGAVARLAAPRPTQSARERQPVAPSPAPATRAADSSVPASLAVIRGIRRSVLPDVVRVIVELDREVPFREERITDPDRVFLDLEGVRASMDLQRPQSFDDGFVRQIRVGQHPDDTVRVVLDVDGDARHSVFALYSPYRLVIDCERPAGQRVALPSEPALVPAVSTDPAATSGTLDEVLATANTAPPVAPVETAAPLPRRDAPATIPTGPPSVNLRGRFSLSRQLGLGVSRIVIDPGHGGRDPGAHGKGLNEADLVLDVALRLERLLLAQLGVEVVLTRRTDVYVPLEERTALANREDADLFLSIHANASRNRHANGVETYVLNFATTRDAEAVAARENAASGQTMHRLPDIVKAITLNNKLDESRDFATFVQQSMIQRLRATNKGVRDLGVKQAPFVVLIGAGMPSVLAEISFLTHPAEGKLLRTSAYRQRIAEALLAGILKYQKSLKSVTSVAQSN